MEKMLRLEQRKVIESDQIELHTTAEIMFRCLLLVKPNHPRDGNLVQIVVNLVKREERDTLIYGQMMMAQQLREIGRMKMFGHTYVNYFIYFPIVVVMLILFFFKK